MVTALGPTWFLEADVAFDIVFMVVTGIVSMMGFRAYRFFKDERHKQLALGFFFIFASYLLLMLTNLFIYLELREVPYSMHDLVAISNITYVGSLIHMAIFLIGLTLLLFLYLPIKEWSVRFLIIILLSFVILLCYRARTTIYVITAIFLLFILGKLFANFRTKRKGSSLLVLLGFTGVFIGEILLLGLAMSPLFYVGSGVATLVGYLLILASLVVR